MIIVATILHRKLKIGDSNIVMVVKMYETGRLHVFVDGRYGVEWPVRIASRILYDKPERVPKYVKKAVWRAYRLIDNYFERRIDAGLGIECKLPLP